MVCFAEVEISMKKFRKIWLGIVGIVIVFFVGYCVRTNFKTDFSGPVIIGGQDKIKVSIHDGDEVLLQGITASDKKDGDVTDSLIVENVSNFAEDGTRIVTYAAFDSDNHISKMQREISYTDYVSPRFELNGSLRFRAGETVNIDKIVSATDCLDGDLSSKVKIRTDSVINNRVTGLYEVKYVVTNSAGDTVTLPINIEIYEPYDHEVEMTLEKYLLYYTGEEIDYKDYLVSIRSGNLEYAFSGVEPAQTQQPEEELPEDSENEDEKTEVTEDMTPKTISKDSVRVESSVNPSKPGVYPVYFYYTAEKGNYTSEAKEVLYVVVE